MTSDIELPLAVAEIVARPGERPLDFAIRLTNRSLDGIPAAERRRLGLFFTPASVARFMAQLARPAPTVRRVLDPGAGTGILSAALCEVLAPDSGLVHLDAYEIHPFLARVCAQVLAYARAWLGGRNVTMTFSVHEGDYITENATSLTPQLFDTHMQPGYDVIISNPPYFKLQKQDRRAIAAAAIVHGQPNIYALFMSVSAALLTDDGVMVTITPRSFTTGEYFRRFRQHLFGIVVPEAVHLFHSRREAFHKDDVLQENVIVRFRRSAPSDHAAVCVGMSTGIDDLEHRSERRIPLRDVVDLRSRNVYFNIPADETDDKIAKFVREWPDTLHRLGLEVSTGPIVAFRCRRFLVHQPCHHQPAVPLLWLHNVRHMSVTWPTGVGGKAQYIHDSEDITPYLVRNATYVVLRRFTAKEERRRLTAAPLLGGSLPGALLGLENHLNYVHRPGGTMHDAEAIGLAALFSSALLDRYFRISNGHTQVNATELRALPLPTHDLLMNLGEEIRRHSIQPDQIDAVVTEVLRVPRSLLGMIDAEGHGQG